VKEPRSLKLWTIAVALIAVGILAMGQVAYPPKGPRPKKISPITFHLEPVTTLQQHLSAGIEKTNADLALTLTELRQGTGPSPDAIRARFGRSYLADPIIWDEGGKPHTGWFERDGVLAYLGQLVKTSTFIQPQSVHVYLEYLPLRSERFAQHNPGFDSPPPIKTGAELKTFLESGVDFLINIRTVLAYAPYDDPPIIGNAEAIPHRFVCWPTY